MVPPRDVRPAYVKASLTALTALGARIGGGRRTARAGPATSGWRPRSQSAASGCLQLSHALRWGKVHPRPLLPKLDPERHETCVKERAEALARLAEPSRPGRRGG